MRVDRPSRIHGTLGGPPLFFSNVLEAPIAQAVFGLSLPQRVSLVSRPNAVARRKKKACVAAGPWRSLALFWFLLSLDNAVRHGR